jgi:hypothetical protein
MVIKIQEFEQKTKRKYVRKVKVVEEQEEDKIFDLDDIIKMDLDQLDEKLSNQENKINELAKDVKKLKIDDSYHSVEEKKDFTLIPIQNKELSLPSSNYISTKKEYNEFQQVKNIINIHQYEFLSKVDIYLYYLIEPISHNVTKYLYYTSVYNTLSGYIMIPTNVPNEYKKCISTKEELIEIVPNVTLHIKQFYGKKREYTYEECNNNLNRKRKIDINNDWSYDFCQLKVKGLNQSTNQNFVFMYENNYITFDYKIDVHFNDIKMITYE